MLWPHPFTIKIPFIPLGVEDEGNVNRTNGLSIDDLSEAGIIWHL